MSKFTAGIIIIGDEILSGRTQDTNANFIAQELIKAGIKLIEIRVVQDKINIIKNTVSEFHKAYTYVFTTGGIGPTHDDITSEGIAKAFNKKYCIHSKAYKILEEHYPKGEFNESRQKMAKLPENAILIPNPLTVAPGFIVENVYVLPGVPDIMKTMFKSLLVNLKKGEPKKICTINTNLYESTIASKLLEIQKSNSDCSIGSYPYFNYLKKTSRVNIVVSSWDRNNLADIRDEIINMISLLGGKSSVV